MMSTMIGDPVHFKTVGDSGGVVHVIPIYATAHRPHNEDGAECWCQCYLEIPCPECDSNGSVNLYCWRCGNENGIGDGWVRAENYFGGPVVVIHEVTTGLNADIGGDLNGDGA